MARRGRRVVAADREARADGEYAVVSLRPSWGAISLVFCTLALGSRFLLRIVDALGLWAPPRGWMWPYVALLVAIAFALAGFAAGWIEARRGGLLGKLGLLTNGAVLVLAGLAAFVAAWIFRLF